MTLITQSHSLPPHSSQTIPIPFPPTPRPLFLVASPCQLLFGEAMCPRPWEVHVLREAFPHQESASQKCGQRAEGSMFRFCLLCLTALFIVKVNDIIPLCMVMKQLNEDSVSQALYMADELLQICRARCVTQLMLPWLESTPRPATMFCTWQRGGSRQGKRKSEPRREKLIDRARPPNLGRPLAPSCSLPFGPQHLVES